MEQYGTVSMSHSHYHYLSHNEWVRTGAADLLWVTASAGIMVGLPLHMHTR